MRSFRLVGGGAISLWGSGLEIGDGGRSCAVHGGVVGADTDGGPVGAGGCIGESGLVVEDGLEEVVSKVGVGAAVARALEEGEVCGVVDGAGEFADGFGESAGEIGDLDLFGDLWFWESLDMEDGVIAFDLLPFEGDAGAGDIEGFAVLSGGVEE